jgi:transposase
MTTISLDLRQRILASYDNGEGTRVQIALRFRVSLGMVKKLLQQRRRLSDIRPQHHRSGRKPLILASHRKIIRRELTRQPDLTLEELRAAAGLACTLPAIHYVLEDMGLTYKKRRSAPANRTAPTSSKPAAAGKNGRRASTPRGSFSLMKAAPKPT